MNQPEDLYTKNPSALASTTKSKSLYALAEAPYKMLYAPHFGMFKNHQGKR